MTPLSTSLLPTAVAVAAGGAIGSVLRFAMGRAWPPASATAIPWTTLGINVVGSLALGWIAGLALARPEFSPTLRAFLTVGLLGGFTTFSAFAVETIGLVQAGHLLRALGYVGASVALAVGAAAVGMAATR